MVRERICYRGAWRCLALIYGMADLQAEIFQRLRCLLSEQVGSTQRTIGSRLAVPGVKGSKWFELQWFSLRGLRAWFAFLGGYSANIFQCLLGLHGYTFVGSSPAGLSGSWSASAAVRTRSRCLRCSKIGSFPWGNIDTRVFFIYAWFCRIFRLKTQVGVWPSKENWGGKTLLDHGIISANCFPISYSVLFLICVSNVQCLFPCLDFFSEGVCGIAESFFWNDFHQ